MTNDTTPETAATLPDASAPAEKALARHASGEIAVVPVATTARELPREGQLAAAQVAPSTGFINAANGTPVVNVLQGFFQNTTVRVCLAFLGLGLAKGGKVVWDAMKIAIAADHHFFQIPWQETFFDGCDAAVIFVVPAIGGLILKILDNNPANFLNLFGKKAADSTKGP